MFVELDLPKKLLLSDSRDGHLAVTVTSQFGTFRIVFDFAFEATAGILVAIFAQVVSFLLTTMPARLTVRHRFQSFRAALQVPAKVRSSKEVSDLLRNQARSDASLAHAGMRTSGLS